MEEAGGGFDDFFWDLFVGLVFPQNYHGWLENHLIFSRRYIFIHEWFSSVMLGMSGRAAFFQFTINPIPSPTPKASNSSIVSPFLRDGKVPACSVWVGV